MLIQLLIGLIPIIISSFMWLWPFNSQIEPRARRWIGKKYQIQIKRKAITKGYWWEVDGYSLTPFKIHLWALLVLIGVQWGVLMIVWIITSRIIELVAN